MWQLCEMNTPETVSGEVQGGPCNLLQPFLKDAKNSGKWSPEGKQVTCDTLPPSVTKHRHRSLLPKTHQTKMTLS